MNFSVTDRSISHFPVGQVVPVDNPVVPDEEMVPTDRRFPPGESIQESTGVSGKG
jgi:hypothetical protein